MKRASIKTNKKDLLEDVRYLCWVLGLPDAQPPIPGAKEEVKEV